MKRSEMDTQAGKFVIGAKPLNTVTEGMVIQRAKEIAVIDGRNANDYTEDEYEQARQELAGSPDAEATELEIQAPVRPAKDEQTVGEDLVKQGVEEATHHTMLAGAERSARKDQV